MSILTSQKKIESLLLIFSSGASQELFNLHSSSFEEEIKETIHLISHLDSFEKSKDHFDLLDEWQFLLAKISYKYGIKTSKFLQKFTSDFDRLDDEELRKYLFTAIKNDEYNMGL